MLQKLCVSFLLTSLCAACGGVDRPSGSIFTAREVTLFGNSADYAQNLEDLGGQWKATWEKDQGERVELADAVAVVRIGSISDDETSSEDPYIRLVATVESKLYGSVDEELTLRVKQTDPGYPSINGKSRSLLSQPFVITLRWQKLDAESDESEEAVPRWHLTPATESVLDFVQERIDAAHGRSGSGARGGRTVVIHDNK